MNISSALHRLLGTTDLDTQSLGDPVAWNKANSAPIPQMAIGAPLPGEIPFGKPRNGIQAYAGRDLVAQARQPELLAMNRLPRTGIAPDVSVQPQNYQVGQGIAPSLQGAYNPGLIKLQGSRGRVAPQPGIYIGD